ncbi:MAG: DUF3455 domain-containing protein [Chitinophagaceae bacterium]
MKKNNLYRIVLAPVIATLVMTACDKDKHPVNDTPAFHIAESEKLFIPAEVDLPSNRPAGNTRVATYYAIGVQKYRAQAKTGGSGVYEWVFTAPRADLFNSSNIKVGTHGAGPCWALSPFDSIFAQAFTPAKTATPDVNSIPWLQLMPKTGKAPTGFFNNVSYVQRIATVGGKAPATPPVSATDTVDVPYTAVYRFTRKN